MIVYAVAKPTQRTGPSGSSSLRRLQRGELEVHSVVHELSRLESSAQIPRAGYHHEPIRLELSEDQARA
jgi:hypothetical protein